MKLKKTPQDYFFYFAAVVGVTVVALQFITLILNIIVQ
jgi:hypothetical protein